MAEGFGADETMFGIIFQLVPDKPEAISYAATAIISGTIPKIGMAATYLSPHEPSGFDIIQSQQLGYPDAAAVDEGLRIVGQTHPHLLTAGFQDL